MHNNRLWRPGTIIYWSGVIPRPTTFDSSGLESPAMTCLGELTCTVSPMGSWQDGKRISWLSGPRAWLTTSLMHPPKPMSAAAIGLIWLAIPIRVHKRSSVGSIRRHLHSSPNSRRVTSALARCTDLLKDVLDV